MTTARGTTLMALLLAVGGCSLLLPADLGADAGSRDAGDTVVDAGAGCTADSDCADVDRCNGDERCVEGFCVPGVPIACDGTICVDGVCVPCIEDQDCPTTAPGCVAGSCRCTSTSCDDGVFCNGAETCGDDGQCRRAEPPCGAETCNEADQRCEACTADNDCDDGVFCNGQEACVDGDCVPRPAPCPSSCDEAERRCGCTIDDDCGGTFCAPRACTSDGLCEDKVRDCPFGCVEAEERCNECGEASDCQGFDPCGGTATCVEGRCGFEPVACANTQNLSCDPVDGCSCPDNCATATPRCDPFRSLGSCVQCLEDRDCTTAGPTNDDVRGRCGPQNTCVKCIEDADCEARGQTCVNNTCQ